jgi:hypothetical protein
MSVSECDSYFPSVSVSEYSRVVMSMNLIVMIAVHDRLFWPVILMNRDETMWPANWLSPPPAICTDRS